MKVVYFEAEDGTGFEADYSHWRSNARGRKAVWLRKDGDYLTIDFCLPRDTEVAVEEVRFSSDGWAKMGAIYIDGTPMGTFNTTDNSNRGFNWNDFHSAGPFSDVVPNLQPGRHQLEAVLVKSMPTDKWGIEIDQVRLFFGIDVTKDELLCPIARSLERKDNDKYRKKFKDERKGKDTSYEETSENTSSDDVTSDYATSDDVMSDYATSDDVTSEYAKSDDVTRSPIDKTSSESYDEKATTAGGL
nr:hypothetical protein BaRGS_027356 [Batillaria attramentaria]